MEELNNQMSGQYKQKKLDLDSIVIEDNFESLLRDCNPRKIYYADSLGSLVERDPRRAIKYFTDQINNNVDCAENLFKRAFTKEVFLEDYLGALEDYNQVIKLDSKFSFPFYRRGELKSDLISSACQEFFFKITEFPQEKIDLINSSYDDIQEKFFELRDNLRNYIFEGLEKNSFKSYLKKFSQEDIFSYLKMFFLVTISEKQKLSYMGELYLAKSAKNDFEKFCELENNHFDVAIAETHINYMEKLHKYRIKAIEDSGVYYHSEYFKVFFLTEILQIDPFHFVAGFFWK